MSNQFHLRAAKVKDLLKAGNGSMPKEGAAAFGTGQEPLTRKKAGHLVLQDMRSAVQELETIRLNTAERPGIDMGFEQYVRFRWGFASMASFYDALGIDPGQKKVAQLYTMPEVPDGYRWLVPEIIREAIRLGIRKSAIWPNLIASEESVSQTSVTMPMVKKSYTPMKYLNEGETIPMGQVSFDTKKVEVQEIASGLKLTDKVVDYVSLNMLSLFLQDLGVNLNMGLDGLAVATLINGDQPGGSESAPVVGTTSGNSITYKDILRVWIRMGRLGRLPAGLLSGEDIALDILDLTEFKGSAGWQKLVNLNVKTPIPNSQNYWIHGTMSDADQVMLIDPTAALIKLNVQPLRVESQRMVENKTSLTAVTITTGFASLMRDARVIIDRGVLFSSQGFPTWMDVSAEEINTKFTN